MRRLAVLAALLASACGTADGDARGGDDAELDARDSGADATDDLEADAVSDVGLPDTDASLDLLTPDLLTGDAQIDGDGDPLRDPPHLDAPGDVGPGPDPACEPLQPDDCLLPWPSAYYLTPDETRATGYTLTLPGHVFPTNLSREPFDTTPYRRLDGFGVGSYLVVRFPNLDVSGLPDETDIGASLEDDAPIVLLELSEDGTRRVPWWAEPDIKDTDPATRALMIRPAEILDEGTRYVVALRDLVDLDGDPISPSPAFAALRAGTTEGDPITGPHQARFDDLFAILDEAGVAPSDLVLAWDFVTASSDALHGAMLHMRDEGLALVDSEGADLVVTSISEEFDGLRIEGTFRTPNYMRSEPTHVADGLVFRIGDDGLPEPDGWVEKPFWLFVPNSALDGTPHGLVQYGHGLMGTGEQVFGGFNRRMANAEHLIFFACSLTGMSDPDVPRVLASASNVSRFPWMADALHQGMLEFLTLGRAMFEGIEDIPALAERGITIAEDERYYSGISQGGIFGATYVALSTDVTRGHLGVPGNNYSLLLERSVDFDGYLSFIAINYPRRIDQVVLLAAVGGLWEGTEPVSYLRHLSEAPFAGNEPNAVLLAPARGDHQVAVLSNEIAARSGLDIAVMANYGRELFAVDETTYPHTGSAVVMYDFGNPWPPPGNWTPVAAGDELDDPHGRPRQLDTHNAQLVHFLRTGEVIDVCGGDGCTPD